MKFAYASGSRPLDGYTIKRGIGIGGFGEVYFATSDAGKEVAIKRVQRNLEIEVRGVTQCLNLKHPNLIALYDIKYDDQGEAWVVMEYVPGESLKDVIDRNPNGMPVDEALRWFDGIARGVAYLHDHGIVHRDLKPGNIFADDDAVKIGDYGLSKFISCSRRSGQTESVGTFHYMAPEIGKGVYGKEIDIYALGIILHEMLTGRVPFDGESSQEIMMKHLTAVPDLSGLPGQYREAVRRSLLKDPARRFSSVAELTGALRGAIAAADGGANVAAPETPPRKPVAEPSPADPVAFTPASAEGDRVVPPTPATRKPPVSRHTGRPKQPIYIGDDSEEMSFGPVKQHAAADRIEMQGVRTQPGVVRTTEPLEIHEPFSDAVKRNSREMAGWWSRTLATPLKVVAVVAIVGLLIAAAASPWIGPLAVFLGALYLVYLGLRSVVVGSSLGESRTPTAANDERIRQAYLQRTRGERAADWIGSLLYSAVVCGLLSLVMTMVGGRGESGSLEFWSAFAWLALTCGGGAWALLTVGKFWETSARGSWLRRGVLVAFGLLVAVASFGVQEALFAGEIDQFLTRSGELSLGPFFLGARSAPEALIQSGRPTLLLHLIYFGGLFAILAWWKHLDPLRSARFSFWATAVCVFWGWLLPFPEPWGLMLAAATAVTVQLSSPWVSPETRTRLGQAQTA